MGLGTLDGAVCAINEEDIRNSRKILTLVSSCTLRAGSSQVRWCGGFQQNLRNRVLGCSLRTGVASDAHALLATAHPEIPGLAFQSLAGTVEQFKLHRSFARNLHKE